MRFALDGAGIDGSLYLDTVRLAHRSPGWLDTLVTDWSAYGLGLFAALMLAAWWYARRTPDSPTSPRGGGAALLALCVPVAVIIAYAANDALKSVVHEVRPCRALHAVTLEACPAATDWSFPSNHAVIAGSAAVALFLVSRRLGALALVAALLMSGSRVWVGAHYPHDVVAGLAVGALIAFLLLRGVRPRCAALASRLAAGRLRPLVAAS